MYQYLDYNYDSTGNTRSYNKLYQSNLINQQELYKVYKDNIAPVLF